MEAQILAVEQPEALALDGGSELGQRRQIRPGEYVAADPGVDVHRRPPASDGVHERETVVLQELADPPEILVVAVTPDMLEHADRDDPIISPVVLAIVLEAELDGGGQDIAARSGSLDETDAGLQAVGEQASEEQERNRQSMEQAEANIDDSRATRADALALQNDLAAHDDVLEAEEMAGRSYVVDFAATYRPYFAATGEGATAVAPGEGSASESGGATVAEENERDETALVA